MQSASNHRWKQQNRHPGSVIESGATVQYAILDENVQVGKGCTIGSPDAGSNQIAVVGAGIHLADQTTVGAGEMVSDRNA